MFLCLYVSLLFILTCSILMIVTWTTSHLHLWESVCSSASFNPCDLCVIPQLTQKLLIISAKGQHIRWGVRGYNYRTSTTGISHPVGVHQNLEYLEYIDFPNSFFSILRHVSRIIYLQRYTSHLPGGRIQKHGRACKYFGCLLVHNYKRKKDETFLVHKCYVLNTYE
jgi:hypothetical protein